MKYLWLILLAWQPLGRLHQVWVLYLKGVPFKTIITKPMYRLMLLESGLLGLLTPWFNKRWRKGRKEMPITPLHKAQ